MIVTQPWDIRDDSGVKFQLVYHPKWYICAIVHELSQVQASMCNASASYLYIIGDNINSVGVCCICIGDEELVCRNTCKYGIKLSL